MVHKKKTSKAFFSSLGASGCPARPQCQSRVSAQVPAQTCNGVAKVSLSFNSPNLANITLKLGALPCHRKQSRMDHCTRPLSSSFFLFNLILQVSSFFSTLFLSVAAEAYQGQMWKESVFPGSVAVLFADSDLYLLDFVSHSLEMPSPPATIRSLWKKLPRSQTFWRKWRSARRFGPLTLQSFQVS